MQRRTFLKRLGLLSAGTILAQLPACSRVQTARHTKSVSLVSAAKDTQGFAVYGLHATGKLLWRFALPERAHAATFAPAGEAVLVMGRRPSTRGWFIDTSTGRLIESIQAAPSRHFFGHAVFSSDGHWVYTTENNTNNFGGLVVARRRTKQGFQVVQEFDSGGIGPHELLLDSNSNRSQIIIANGGIKTAAGSREKLNLDTMQPNLTYIDAASGHILQTIKPPHHQLSVRHIAQHDDGTVAIGMQYQGAAYHNQPLIFTHQFGDAAMRAVNIPNNNWLIFNQYIGSVAIDSTHAQLCATSPRGGCLVVVDLRTRECLKKLNIRDCGGVTAQLAGGFLVSDGSGGLNTTSALAPTTTSHTSAPHTSAALHTAMKLRHSGVKWDNHISGVS